MGNIKNVSQLERPILTNIELISSGWINKYILTYDLPNGNTITYETVSRKDLEAYERELRGLDEEKPLAVDAICIVPRTVDNELVLIKEFRYPLNSWCIAFPAGLIEAGEDLMTCLERELREETGYKLHLVKGSPLTHPLNQAGYSSTGMTDETVQVVYAKVEKAGEPDLDPNELIEVFTLPIEDVPRFLKENTLPIGTRCQLILESFARDEKRAQLCRP